MNNLNETIFVKNKKYEHGGRWNVKIHSFFFVETTHEPLHSDKLTLV
jgi:hypothetical protein